MTVRSIFKAALALAAVVALGGCSHQIYFSGRSSGAVARTTITTSMGQSSGDMTLDLKGKTFTGRWVYVKGGGAIGFGSGFATNGRQTVSTSSFGSVFATRGNGSMILTAADGTGLRCVYDYSQDSMTGVGECEDSTGEGYDLQIN